MKKKRKRRGRRERRGAGGEKEEEAGKEGKWEEGKEEAGRGTGRGGINTSRRWDAIFVSQGLPPTLHLLLGLRRLHRPWT